MSKIREHFQQETADARVASFIRPCGGEAKGFIVRVEVTLGTKTYVAEELCQRIAQLEETQSSLLGRAETWFFPDTGNGKAPPSENPDANAKKAAVSSDLQAALSVKLELLPAAPKKAKQFEGKTIGELRATTPVMLGLLAKNEGTPMQAVTDVCLAAIKTVLRSK